ncbi:MAG TPA: hypothetical protein VEW07_02310 [Solirubrobacterales bacterium]|nr:hypothetical protein [Solirubrobacterales bacterium]
MTSPSRLSALALLGAVLSTLALAVSTVPAQAASRSFLGVIADSTPVQPPPPPPAEPFVRFEDACGVAVDGEGRVYISDYRRHAIGVFAFDPGDPLTPVPRYQTQIKAVGPLDGPCELAVDSEGRVYVNDYHQSVLRYTPDEFPFAFLDPPIYGGPQTIDSDNATGVAINPADDVVYVAHRKYVAAYQPSGDPVLAAGEPLRIGLGSLGDGNGIAVSGFAATAGYVYVADAEDDTVKVYDPAADPADPVEVIDGSATPQGHFEDLADSDLAVDDSNGHFLVLDNLQSGFKNPAAVVAEFGPRGGYRAQLPHALIHEGPSGIAVDNSSGAGKSRASGRVYVLSGDSSRLESSLLYGFGLADPTPTHLLDVAKSGSGGGAVTSVPAGIACGTACLGEFTAGAAVTLTATDDGHSAFKGWTVAGQPGACPGTGSCQLTLAADTEVSAEFEALPQQSLTVAKTGSGDGAISSLPAGIECGTVCVSEFNAGSTVTLSAVPAPRSAFKGWTVAGQPGACPGISSCQVTLGVSSEIVAEFEALPQLTLAVSKAGIGKGRVKSNLPGIDCGSSCAAGFDRDSTVILSAIPASGSRFGGWSGGGCAGTGPCAVTLAAATSVSASFEPLEALPIPPVALIGRTLAISVTGSGSGTITGDPAGIDCGAPCAAVYLPGTRVTLTATPAPESRFAGWSGCESVSANRCTVTLAGDRTVAAGFEETAPLRLAGLSVKGTKAVLKLSVPGPGSISAAGKKMKPAKATTRKAGTVTLPLTLGKAGKQALEKAGKLAVKVRIAFKPSWGGPPLILAKTVTFVRGVGAGR